MNFRQGLIPGLLTLLTLLAISPAFAADQTQAITLASQVKIPGAVLPPGSYSFSAALKGWKCPGCAVGLEFVYPKLEAVGITKDSAAAVLAMDPEYDKLPAHLSPDDMKVVTLWLVSPKRITADNQVADVTAVKYASASALNAATPTEAASAGQPHSGRHLPKTASNTFSLALWGLLLLAGAGGVHLVSRRGSAC